MTWSVTHGRTAGRPNGRPAGHLLHTFLVIGNLKVAITFSRMWTKIPFLRLLQKPLQGLVRRFDAIAILIAFALLVIDSGNTIAVVKCSIESQHKDQVRVRSSVQKLYGLMREWGARFVAFLPPNVIV